MERPLRYEAGFNLGQCFGTEPYWSVGFDVDGQDITYDLMGYPQAQGKVTDRYDSRNRIDRFSLFILLERTRGGPQVVIQASPSQEDCSDQMSDRAYGIGVEALVWDPETREQGAPDQPVLLSGCCTMMRN